MIAQVSDEAIEQINLLPRAVSLCVLEHYTLLVEDPYIGTPHPTNPSEYYILVDVREDSNRAVIFYRVVGRVNPYAFVLRVGDRNQAKEIADNT